MPRFIFPEIESRLPALSENEQKGVNRLLNGEPVECSTSIGGDTTFGYGELDDYGFWEFSVPQEIMDFFKGIKWE